MAAERELAEVRELFSGSLPQIFGVMADKGVLELVWPLLRDALVGDDGIPDRRVREGLIVALSTHCSNNYCFVAHSFLLLALGFDMASIKALVEELTFPADIDDHEKWGRVLTWAYLSGGHSGPELDKSASSVAIPVKLLNEDEYRRLFKICTAVSVLNRFSEYYPSQISVDQDEMLSNPDGSLSLPVPDLVTYYEDRRSRRPVSSICMYCKRIADSDGTWHALESALSSLDHQTGFTHGICPSCEPEHFK